MSGFGRLPQGRLAGCGGSPGMSLARRTLWRHGIPERTCRIRGRVPDARTPGNARLEGARRGLPQRQHPDLDLTATSPDGSVTVEFQVKTTTDGDIRWKKPGREKVDPWIAKAETRGRLTAVVMIWANEKSVWLKPDPDRRGYFFPGPEILQMTAMTARDFGDLVDQRRAEYGQQTRRRLYRGRGRVGEPLSPDDLMLPVSVGDGQSLEDFLAWLQLPDGRDSGLARPLCPEPLTSG